MKTIGIDLGGTRIKGVVLDNSTGQVLHRILSPTNDGQAGDWKAVIAQIVTDLKATTAESIEGIGLAAPGLANTDNSAIVCMPGRLQGLEGFNWADWLDSPVRVLNDAHAALLAEARFGAAKNSHNALMLTLGTGVGGGLLIGGQLYQGFFQKAGHAGHITVNADSEQLDVTNIPGSLEDAIGNVTVSRRSYGRYQTTHELVEAYQQGEPLASLVWLTSLRRLAVGIASLANLLSPDVVILGGGITQAGDALFGPLTTFMDLFDWQPVGQKTVICKADFDDWAGAIGAAASVLD